MIVTKDFVLLNFPKTGSSFARHVIKKIYSNRLRNNIAYRIGMKLKLLPPYIFEHFTPHIGYRRLNVKRIDQHGLYSQIPTKYLDRPVFSIVRNPYEKLISSYRFKFWAIKPMLSDKIIQKKLPNFPDLTLEEYIQYLNLIVIHNYNIPPGARLGYFTIQFIEFFSKNPEYELQKIRNGSFNFKELLNGLGELSLLTQENLRKDLISYLNLRKKEEIAIIMHSGEVNVTKENENYDLSQYANDYIKNKEFLLFDMLKYYNVNYEIR